MSFQFRMDCISRHVACVALDFSSVKRGSSGVVLSSIWAWRFVLGSIDALGLGRLVLSGFKTPGLAQNGGPRLRLRVGVLRHERLLAHDADLAGIFAPCLVFRLLLQRMDPLC